jgi:hypothetical protein
VSEQARILRDEITVVKSRLSEIADIVAREGATMTGSRGTPVQRPEIREQIHLRDQLYKLASELRRRESAEAIHSHKAKRVEGPPTMDAFIALGEAQIYGLERKDRLQLQDELGKQPSAELRTMLATGEISACHLRSARFWGGDDALIANPRRRSTAPRAAKDRSRVKTS